MVGTSLSARCWLPPISGIFWISIAPPPDSAPPQDSRYERFLVPRDSRAYPPTFSRLKTKAWTNGIRVMAGVYGCSTGLKWDPDQSSNEHRIQLGQFFTGKPCCEPGCVVE